VLGDELGRAGRVVDAGAGEVAGKTTEGVVNNPAVTARVDLLATKAIGQQIRRLVKTAPDGQLVTDKDQKKKV
jgi:hypothetical protein